MAAPPIYSGTVNNTPNSTHTLGDFESYTAKPGQLFLAASQWVAPAASSTGATLVLNSAGNFVWHVAAASTVKFYVDVAAILRQTVLTAIPSQSGNIYNSANANTIPTGLAIVSVQALYKINAVNIVTAPVLSVTQSVFPANNAAANPTVTNILSGTNLATAFRANLYNTLISTTTQTMISTALAVIAAEIDIVTPSGGTFDFYGVFANVNYLY